MPSRPFPSPTLPISDERDVLLDYLDFFRDLAVDKVSGMTAHLGQQAGVTRQVVRSHGLDDFGQPGERWDGAPPPPLRRVLLHLLQEYARHVGHLDIVRELTDGSVGEAAASAPH